MKGNIIGTIACLLSLVLLGATTRLAIPCLKFGFHPTISFGLIYPLLALASCLVFLRRHRAPDRWINTKRGLLAGSSIFVIMQIGVISTHYHQILEEGIAYGTYIMLLPFDTATPLFVGGILIGWIMDLIKNRRRDVAGHRISKTKTIAISLFLLVAVQLFLGTDYVENILGNLLIIFVGSFLLVLVFGLLLLLIAYAAKQTVPRGLRGRLLTLPLGITLAVFIAFVAVGIVNTHRFRKNIVESTRLVVRIRECAMEDRYTVIDTKDADVIKKLAQTISLPPFMLPWMEISGCGSYTIFDLYRNGEVYDSFHIDGWTQLTADDYTKQEKLSHLSEYRILTWLAENGANKKMEEARLIEQQRKALEDEAEENSR